MTTQVPPISEHSLEHSHTFSVPSASVLYSNGTKLSGTSEFCLMFKRVASITKYWTPQSIKWVISITMHTSVTGIAFGG